MFGIKELKKIASREKVPQATIEKDYALSVALAVISKISVADKLVFKGGTAIKKIYFEKARFSEDLDFTVLERAGKEGLLPEISNAFSGKEISGIKFESLEEEKTSAGTKASIKFVGPLQHPQRIRFDFSFRENIHEKPIKREVIDNYGLGKCVIQAMSIEEIFTEKIHALGSRTAPRDLYDAWFLLENKAKLDRHLLGKKFAHYKEKVDPKKFLKNINQMQSNWKRDLQMLLKNIPDFDKTAEKVKKEIIGGS